MILRKTSRLLLSLIFITLQSELVQSLGQIIYAVNCGGEAHTDTFGVHYERDPLNGKVGIASDYGKRLLIGRVHPDDNILYQTERYHTNTFGYDIPISGDGDYVLVLKFCEVYFNAVDQKVFDIVLNGDHTVISDLDIFEKVGRGFAHDEYVPFTISKGKLHLHTDEEPSGVRGGRIRLEFIKGYRDNPKVNAIFVMRGKLDQVPRLPPIEPDPVEEVLRGEQQQQQQETEEDFPGNQDDQQPQQQRSTRRPNVPKLQPDPYMMEEDSSVMLPVFIAIGAFIPILFCLCKL